MHQPISPQTIANQNSICNSNPITMGALKDTKNREQTKARFHFKRLGIMYPNKGINLGQIQMGNI